MNNYAQVELPKHDRIVEESAETSQTSEHTVNEDLTSKTSRDTNSLPNVKNIYCGYNYWVQPGFWFNCWDIHDNYWKRCVGTGGGHYQCHDGQEWEWANWYERDGTADGSFLTSVHTDGQHWTSASPGVMDRLDSSA